MPEKFRQADKPQSVRDAVRMARYRKLRAKGFSAVEARKLSNSAAGAAAEPEPGYRDLLKSAAGMERAIAKSIVQEEHHAERQRRRKARRLEREMAASIGRSRREWDAQARADRKEWHARLKEELRRRKIEGCEYGPPPAVERIPQTTVNWQTELWQMLTAIK